MASGNPEVQAASYACKCLNVRIKASQPTSAPPEYPRHPDYTPVFVQDDGISVTHPQVTVRIASKGEPISGTAKCSRFTALTCLVCNLPIYRVCQVISLDVEGNESTLLPTEDWVEHEIMKSATGWIDVHKDSLVGDGITEVESSSSYAPYLSLLLPSCSSPSSSHKEELTTIQSKPPSDEPPPTYLSDLPPLFLPPPFTSSHPIFVLLAGLASKESQALRAAAEQRILDFVKAETAGIERKEMELKSQVDALWKTFKQHLSAVQQDRSQHNNSVRSPTRVQNVKDLDFFSANGSPSGSQVSSSVKITSFVPQRVSSNLTTISQSLPRLSALSASLATSGFHHPRETRQETISVTDSSVSHGSSSSTLSTPRSGSSTLVHPIARTAGVSTQEYKPNLDDNLNTQASYRYFVTLEEDMARHKRAREEELAKKREETTGWSTDHIKRAGASQAESSSSLNGTTGSNKLEDENPQSSPAKEASKPDGETTPSRGRDKGKRKQVTFNVVPAVLTTQGDGESTEGEAAAGDSDSREMLFPLEDIDGQGEVQKSTNERHTTLPLLEQPAPRPVRPRNIRPNAGLEAFASLRPASLPNPSHIRPVRSQPGVDSSSQGMIPVPRASTSSVRNEGPSRIASSPAPPLSEHDAAILKLVAAETPSHRGAWAPNSKAWQTFTRRQDSKSNLVSKKASNIPEEGAGGEAESSKAGVAKPETKSKAVKFEKKSKVFEFEVEEDEDDVYKTYAERGLPGSMPIGIIRPKKKEPLSLASYVAPSAIPEQPRASAPSPGSGGKTLSATAIREAAYAERDRNRGKDPGALDFAVQDSEEEDEEEGENETDPVKNDPRDAGHKARKQALKILQARSELPEEGMWRSLA